MPPAQDRLPPQPDMPMEQTPAIGTPAQSPSSGLDQGQIFDALSKLGSLRDQGILTDDEFATKKAELLARL